jgi:hypothetical protein
VTIEDVRAANCVFKAPFNLYGSYMTMSSTFKEDLMATDVVQQLLKRYAGFKEELRQKNDYISSLENINELLYEKGRKDTLKI